MDDANAETRTAIGAWAQGAGLPTIDVAVAFEESGSEGLLVDEVDPSEEWSRLWAETVGAAPEGWGISLRDGRGAASSGSVGSERLAQEPWIGSGWLRERE